MINDQGNPVTMNDLIDAGVLEVDGIDDDGGFLLELHWEKLKEYSIELYLKFREAEMTGEMIQ
ncbi:hypothetical protein HUN41_00146 [Streptomyces phage Coruscant]|uniref:Uncharacterized protein n=1 Tax=Streptomyces phage Coruscant TaxID=2739834 RepID=A0A7G4AW67_9CAUD|nr:hypothetical protein PP454_gp160 [Streptomyces phage Coruscant]QMP84257.1 hypothetical protein HUN41_00146 [Streptomyces phage Coruscant]